MALVRLLNVKKVVAILAFSLLSAMAGEIRQVDIIGLRLGMSPDEVESILKAYDKTLKIERRYTTYEYSDGKQQLASPQVLSGIMATKNIYNPAIMASEDDRWTLNFSADPKRPILISVNRDLSGWAKPTTRAAYEDALKKKYGEPTRTEKPDTMIWKLGGGRYRCASLFAQTIASQPIQVLNDIRAGWDAAKDCEALLAYRVATDPSTTVMASLYDPAMIAEADRRLGEWLGKLEADSKAKLTKGAPPPKL
jgi:hypothetical protein